MEFTLKEYPGIKLYYRFKKITKSQNEFIAYMADSLIKNTCSIYEFPPTLDKDYLYNSLLFSLARQTNQKFIILVNNYDKISELMKNFSHISNICKRYTQDFQNLKIVPWFDRKMICLNKKALETANSLDFDSYCTKVTASWLPDKDKCRYYNNYSKDFAGSLLIEYDSNSNSNYNGDKMPQFYHLESSEFQNTFSNLVDKEICPFYYYFGLIKYTNPDIIICNQKDYFDIKSRIQIFNLISQKISDYKIVLDECSNINSNISMIYSMTIDDNILSNASNQLFVLKENFTSSSNDMSDFASSYKLIKSVIDKNNGDINRIEVYNEDSEKEFILFSGFPKIENKFPGNIRKSAHLLNLISRLITYFKRMYFNLKSENLFWNLYKIEQQFLVDLWLEIKNLNFLFKRFILFLNEINFCEYQDIYHLLVFIFFINYLASYKEGYLLSYQKYYNSDNFFLELNLIEPHLIINKLLFQKSDSHKINNPIFLSGGIGKLEIFEKMLKLQNCDYVMKKAFIDDNIQQNLYLTNISNTNVNNNSFYGEILMKLCKSVPDGIVCYFSSVSLMEYYIQKWNEQEVFDTIMNDKLLFIEEQDPVRLAKVVTNYKKCCDVGRGAILFLSTRNRAALLDNSLVSHQSRCIIFIGFPIETKLTKIFEIKLEHYKKNFDVESKEFLNYNAFKLFSNKISDKICDITDKKVLVILDDRLISEKLKEYLPSWLHKLIHVDFDKENVNTDERLKNIKGFFS